MSDTDITYLTDVSLLTCVVQSGFSEDVLKATRSVGARLGVISHRAKGIGARERLGILGIAVEAEKEVISLLVSTDQQNLVYDTIYRAANLDVPGRGFIYITPLEKASTFLPESVLKQLDTTE